MAGAENVVDDGFELGALDAASEQGPVGNPYPSTSRLILVTVGLSLSIFLAALDSTILAQAIPSITEQFGSIANIAWYGTAYSITNTAFNLVWGKAYKYFKLKPTFLLAIAIFELGNVICATASSSDVVIAGRIVSGLGGAGLICGSFIIMAIIAKPQYRALMMGITSLTFAGAGVVGPLMGGGLVDTLGWRWCFWINLPIGAIAAGVMIAFFSQPSNVSPVQAKLMYKMANMDINGGLLTAGSLACFVLAMHWVGTLPLHSPQIIGSLGGFGFFAVLFGLNERVMKSRAMVQSHLLKNRNIARNSLFAFFFSGVYFPLLYTLPVQFQSVGNASAAQSGVRLIPLILGISIFTLISNGLLTIWQHYNPFFVVGALAGTAGVSVMYTFDAHTTTASWIGTELMTSVGVGLALQIPVLANNAAVGTEDIAAATSLALFLENIGTTLFVAASEAAFTAGLVNSVKQNLPDIKPQIVVNTGVTQIRSTFSQAQIPGVLSAYLNGCKDSHLVPMACGSAALLLAVVHASPSAARGARDWFSKARTV